MTSVDTNGEDYKLWLESLKVGDKVALEGYNTSKIIFTEITKITPKKGIRLKWNEFYLFKNGRTNSGGTRSSGDYKVIPITNELIQKEKQRRMIEKLSAFKEWKKLEVEDINYIYKIIFKPQDNNP